MDALPALPALSWLPTALCRVRPLRNTLHAEGVLGTFIFPEHFFMTTSLLSARHCPGWTAKEANQLLFRDLG